MAGRVSWSAAVALCLCAACPADPPVTHWGEPADGLQLGVCVEVDRLCVGIRTFLKNTGQNDVYVCRSILVSGGGYIQQGNINRMVYQQCWAERPIVVRLLERKSPSWSLGPETPAPICQVQPWLTHLPHMPTSVLEPTGPPTVTKLAPGEILDCGFEVRPRCPAIAGMREPALQCGLRVQAFAEPPDAKAVAEKPSVLLVTPIVAVPGPPMPAISKYEAAFHFYARFVDRLAERPDTPGLDVLVAMATDRGEPKPPNGEQPPARELGLYALSKVGRPKAVDTLMQVCKDRDDPLRGEATLFLGRANDRRAVPLLAALCEDPNQVVRAHAAAGLGTLKAAEHVAVLAKMVKSDPFPSARENAARALGQIGGEVALATLNAALADPHHNVRYNVILALRRLGDRRSIAPLADFLDRAKRPEDSIAIDEAAATIDVIAGKRFDGNVKAIREWLSALQEEPQKRPAQ